MAKGKSKSVVPHANQYLLDPRQLKCWDAYINPKSETFGNALQSAMAAGYPRTTAGQITTEKWWLEKVRRLNMVSKAERNLDETLDFPTKTQAMGAFGPLYHKSSKKGGKKMPVMTYNLGLLNLKARASEFVVERLAPQAWGKKGEGDGGNKILIINISGQSVSRYGAHAIAG